MTEIILCILAGAFSILGLFIGSHLNRRNTDKDIFEKRLELYKPLYFTICVYDYDTNTIKQEITNWYNSITSDKDEYLLLDSKTRIYLITMYENISSNYWDNKTLEKKVKKFKRLVDKEFVKIQQSLGYPVSPTKHILTNISFGFAVATFSGFFMINDFSILVNTNNIFVSIYVVALVTLFLISITYFITHIHYFGNY